MAKLKNKYCAEIELFWSYDDGDYTANVYNLRMETLESGVPTLNSNLIGGPFIGISAGGKSPRLALKELGVALQLCLEDYEEEMGERGKV